MVLDKPKRGREMVTTEVPTATRQPEGEMYHEGWVGGKKYLVPDSNLEIMKDLVNLKIRRKGDSVFVKDKEYEASRFDTQQKFQKRLMALSEKIDKLENAKLLKKKSIYEGTEDARPATTSSMGSGLVRRKPFQVVPISEESTTFLISGHIRQNSSPLFIIQKYKGKSPFGRKRSDFSQVKSARNVDILISGNFFRQSVLEEGFDSIEGIRLRWNLLVPVDERSKLYETRFSQHFDVKGIDILFEGDFIKQRGLLNYTPILTFLVPQPVASTERGRRRKNKKLNIFRSVSNMFRQKNVTTYNVQLESRPSIKSRTDDLTSREDSISISLQSSSGDWSSTEGLDEEESTGKEQTTDQEERRSGYGNDGDNNRACQIRLVMVSSGNGTGRRSVAGGSSSVKLTQDEPPPVVQAWSNRDVDEEETVVVYAAKDRLWAVEPHLRSYSSHSTCERDSLERSDQGDAGQDNKYQSEEHPVNNTATTELGPSHERIVQATFRKAELTKWDTPIRPKIPEYKCQVRPSKRGSQKNCLLRNISKLFSK